MVNQPAPGSDAIGNQHESLGAWAKRYYFANRSAIDLVLRPHGLGSTQWHVLYQLVHGGSALQRDVARLLHLERATLSGVIATLVRKGLVEQLPTAADQRQRELHLTEAGLQLWRRLPDPMEVIREHSLRDISESDKATAVRVLRTATERLNDYFPDGGGA